MSHRFQLDYLARPRKYSPTLQRHLSPNLMSLKREINQMGKQIREEKESVVSLGVIVVCIHSETVRSCTRCKWLTPTWKQAGIKRLIYLLRVLNIDQISMSDHFARSQLRLNQSVRRLVKDDAVYQRRSQMHATQSHKVNPLPMIDHDDFPYRFGIDTGRY